jgi:hypothetical protein
MCGTGLRSCDADKHHWDHLFNDDVPSTNSGPEDWSNHKANQSFADWDLRLHDRWMFMDGVV